MTVVLTGSALSLDEVVRVARDGEAVALGAGVDERMARARRVFETVLVGGEAVYCPRTSGGVLERVPLPPDEVARFNCRLPEGHRVAQGACARSDVVRATMLRLANGFAAGHAGVRPVLAERLVAALNRGVCPVVRELGSPGEADLAPLADLAAGLFTDTDLAPGEGLALLDNNACSTASAALSLHDAGRLLDAADAVAALSLEAFAANLTILHPGAVAARPDDGLTLVVDRLRRLLDGSYLWREGAARNLQDPLTFRSLPGVHGACHDALAYAARRLAVELNAAQGNPLVLPADEKIISGADFEVLALAAGLDLARIALSPLLTSAGERVVKLLETPWSGLPTGLAASAATSDGALAIYAVSSAALTAEARLLAQPVSFELVSATGAEGIEGGAAMDPLGARRLAEMVGLGERIVASELLVAAQAVELRGSGPLGRGTRRVFELVRERTPFVGAGYAPPADLDELVELIRSEVFLASERPLAAALGG